MNKVKILKHIKKTNSIDKFNSNIDRQHIHDLYKDGYILGIDSAIRLGSKEPIIQKTSGDIRLSTSGEEFLNNKTKSNWTMLGVLIALGVYTLTGLKLMFGW